MWERMGKGNVRFPSPYVPTLYPPLPSIAPVKLRHGTVRHGLEGSAGRPATHVLVQEAVEPVGEALPGHLEEGSAQALLEGQQVVPHAKHHGTRGAGQGHGGLVALGGQRQPPGGTHGRGTRRGGEARGCWDRGLVVRLVERTFKPGINTRMAALSGVAKRIMISNFHITPKWTWSL